jgi:probable biosynthetic protein (TIGR04098 family)
MFIGNTRAMAEMLVKGLLAEATTGLTSPEDALKSFDELGIASFDLLVARASIERVLGTALPDAMWTSANSPQDLIEILVMHAGEGSHARASHDSNVLSRKYRIGMPQMAIGGLSESWLLKETGDLHWKLLAAGLGVSASELSDQNGDRLYATFTRVQWSASQPLSVFREDEAAMINSTLSRFGNGLFFGEHEFQAESGSIELRTSSSFAKRTKQSSNVGLTRGQPEIPDECPITVLDELPPFGRGYQAQRQNKAASVLFSTEYKITPLYDINGVGLLYFAAFPAIADLCEAKYKAESADWPMRSSAVSRDVFYFGNSDYDETVVYKVHAERKTEATLEIASSLTRKSDGGLMAYMVTHKDVW